MHRDESKKQYFDDITATETWLYILGKYQQWIGGKNWFITTDSLKSTDLSHFKVKYRKIYLRTVICIYYILDGKFISDASLDFSSDIK